MAEIFSNLGSTITFRWTDAIDILIVAFLAYKIIVFIRETRAEQLVKGLVFLVIATYLSELFHFHALNYILKGVLTLGAVALIIVFQPELRRGLEYIGRGHLFSGKSKADQAEAKRAVGAITNTVRYFSRNKIGALIVFERGTMLNDIIETGVEIDAKITEELLGTIFYVGTPLHDGATVIRGLEIKAAGCVLPLTQDLTLNKELGTRHRAAIGLSEICDALVLVVSEETGTISMVVDGKIRRKLSPKAVENTLLGLYISKDTSPEGFVGNLKAFGARFRNDIKLDDAEDDEEESEEVEQIIKE